MNLRDAGTADISFLLDFPRLKYLLLSGNQIIDLSPLLPLTKLNRLVLINNKISRLPAAWADREMEIKWDYNHQNGLYLEGNPLEIPPVEIVQQGDASVRNYFKEKKGA